MIKLEKNSTVLFYGDSITHGGRLNSMDGNHVIGHGYQEMLSARMGFENLENMPKFINKGVSGDAVCQLYGRLTADVLKYKPDMISILVGVNDIYRGFGLPHGMTTDKFIAVYRMMINDIRTVLGDPTIIICEPFYLDYKKPEDSYKNTPYVVCETPFYPGYFLTNSNEIEEFSRKEMRYMQSELKKLVIDSGCIFVPLQEEFDKAAEIVPPEYLIWDTVHPTIVGHEIIARRWYEVVDGVLGK